MNARLKLLHSHLQRYESPSTTGWCHQDGTGCLQHPAASCRNHCPVTSTLPARDPKQFAGEVRTGRYVVVSKVSASRLPIDVFYAWAI